MSPHAKEMLPQCSSRGTASRLEAWRASLGSEAVSQHRQSGWFLFAAGFHRADVLSTFLRKSCNNSTVPQRKGGGQQCRSGPDPPSRSERGGPGQISPCHSLSTGPDPPSGLLGQISPQAQTPHLAQREGVWADQPLAQPFNNLGPENGGLIGWVLRMNTSSYGCGVHRLRSIQLACCAVGDASLRDYNCLQVGERLRSINFACCAVGDVR